MSKVLLIALFIYFQGKIKFSHSISSICFFWIFILISAILLSKMKSLFSSLWKFAKFFMSFLKVQLSFPSHFASNFTAIKHNSSALLQLKHYILWSKRSHYSATFWNLRISSAPGQNLLNSSCQFWNDKSIPLQVLHQSSLSCSISHLYFLSSNNIYFAEKEPIKVKLFETFECLGQNSSNSSCRTWNNKSVPLQILRRSSVSRKITPLYFFSSNNLCFAQKEPIKVKIFETFEWTGQNLSKFIKLLMSILKWQKVNSSSNFASFLIVTTHNSSVKFKFI